MKQVEYWTWRKLNTQGTALETTRYKMDAETALARHPEAQRVPGTMELRDLLEYSDESASMVSPRPMRQPTPGHDVFFETGSLRAWCFFVEEERHRGWSGHVHFVRMHESGSVDRPGYRQLVPGAPFATREELHEAARQFVLDSEKNGTTGV